MQIVIGRCGTQPFPINDLNVSSKHALLIVERNQMFLVDTNSTNGTFVYNGSQFVRIRPKEKYPVTKDTFVRFGPQTQMHISRLLPEEEKCDISNLKHVHETYNKRKLELQTEQQSINGLRSATIFIMMGSTVIGTFLSGPLNLPDDSTGKLISGAIGLAVGAVIWLAIQMYTKSKLKKNLYEQNENEQFYSRHYTCPKCHISHKGHVYENILATGECPRCKVKYIDAEMMQMPLQGPPMPTNHGMPMQPMGPMQGPPMPPMR